MSVELISSLAVEAIDPPDTGSLRGDVREYLANARTALEQPLVRTIVPDLLAEANRDSELAEAFLVTIRDPRRAKAADLINRAIARGELPEHTDVELCLDMLGGPLYWRMTAIHTELGPDYLDRLTDKVVAAFHA